MVSMVCQINSQVKIKLKYKQICRFEAIQNDELTEREKITDDFADYFFSKIDFSCSA